MNNIDTRSSDTLRDIKGSDRSKACYVCGSDGKLIYKPSGGRERLIAPVVVWQMEEGAKRDRKQETGSTELNEWE